MKKAAVFLARYGVGNSPSIINLLDLLSDNCKVDFYHRSCGLLDAPILSKRGIRPIHARRRRVLAKRLTGLVLPYERYDVYICFDPHGFVLCREMFPSARPIYYSLEMYLLDDHYGLPYPPETRVAERKHINDISALIIQSREKERIFRREYGLRDEIPAFILPVTYDGPSSGSKSDYLRTKYGIGKGKRIALHLGEIKWWYSCIEIAREFARLKDWVLVFHGYSEEDYLMRLKSVVAHNRIENVIISDRTHNSISSIDEIVRSCDVGIAWYNDISTNFRTAGGSSGKIAAYLRYGLPVIATRYESTIDAIERPGCGVCVTGYDEIEGALNSIIEKYANLSSNALSEYDRNYNFAGYRTPLLEFVRSTGNTRAARARNANGTATRVEA